MRADLPSGTVTFLFTDVEGSTKLLQELGADAYAEALAEHRRAIRDACVAAGGVEVDTQGDAFFFAFPTAPGAVAAAEAMTAALASGPIRVRAGLHTGTPLLAEEGYVGDDVHRAARIAAAGHGGQVLVSAATASLVEVELTDLGEHRFKDLGAPERVCQLGDGGFPPLKSLYRTNLPVPATGFLGRERELADIGELLSDSARLVTLTGPGGTGKTRLAIQAAAEAAESFADGIWWISMSPLRDARLVTSAVAQSLSVEEEPGKELIDSVARRLTGKRALLVFDNAEHLMPDVGTTIADIRDIPGPSLLVTSRERLRIEGEHVYSVPALTNTEGIELFLTRAQAVGSAVEDSEEIAELCSRLDNLPLALELAAARTVVFSPEQLVERLSQRLDLLKAGRDADPRQQTLRATIEWSYGLLEAEEQRLLRALSVFSGGATYEAAEAVCVADPDTLQSLLDKSLVRRREEMRRPRYWQLESIREFAGEQLRVFGEDADLRRRHAEHYLAVALSAGLAPDVEGEMRHDLVIPERDNMRAALTWAVENSNWELGLELFVALENYWATNAPHEGLREWAGTLLSIAPSESSRLRFRAMRVQGGMENILGHPEASRRIWEEALAMARELDDELGVAILLHRLASSAVQRGDMESVRVYAEESLAAFRHVGGYAKGEAQALTSLAEVRQADGDLEGALELLQEARRLATTSGFRWWQAGASARIAAVLLHLDRLDDARANATQALSLSSTMRDRSAIAYELGLLAEISRCSNDSLRAGTLFGAVEAEDARAPLGSWLHGRVRFQPGASDPALEQGLDEGRRLSLDEALAFALGDAP